MLCSGVQRAAPGVAAWPYQSCQQHTTRGPRRAARFVARSAQQQDGEPEQASTSSDQAPAAPASRPPANASADGRLKAALSYREKRKAEDMDMIAQAASRTDKSTGLRPEMETYLKENREMEVEIISVNKDYKPKVSTWGVFPRPIDISATYGGGRDIKPGTTLETPEQTKARVDRVKNAVGAYRKKIGYDVDVENVEEVREILKKGIDLLEMGKLEQAAALLQQVTELAPLMSEEGGSARLQLAVALDSLNRSDEAKRLYQSLSRHPNVEYVKRANRMLWGMTTAAEFLKADKIQYKSGMREAYARYFNSMTGSWGLYSAEQRDEEGERNLQILSAAAIVTLVAFPAGLFFALKQLSDAN